MKNLDKGLLLDSGKRLIIGLFFMNCLVIVLEFLFQFMPQDSENHTLTTIEGFVFFSIFLTMFISTTAIISYFGGWQFLQKQYRCESYKDTRLKTNSIGMAFGYLPPASYGNCINVREHNDGIVISAFIFFRFFHPPLFIPWKDIQMIKYKEGIFSKNIVLRVDKVKLYFSGKFAQELNERFESE